MCHNAAARASSSAVRSMQIQARFHGVQNQQYPQIKLYYWHFIADLANYPAHYGLRSGDRFGFQCVFAALRNVANHRHICRFLLGNSQSEAFILESTHCSNWHYSGVVFSTNHLITKCSRDASKRSIIRRRELH